MIKEKDNDSTDLILNENEVYSDSSQCIEDNVWVICSTILRSMVGSQPGIGIMYSSSEFLNATIRKVNEDAAIFKNLMCIVPDNWRVDDIVHSIVTNTELGLYIVDRPSLFKEENKERMKLLTAAVRTSRKIVVFRHEDDEDEIKDFINPLIFVLQGSFSEAIKSQTEEKGIVERPECELAQKDCEIVKADEEDSENSDNQDPDTVGHILFDEQDFLVRYPSDGEENIIFEMTRKHVEQIANILRNVPMMFQRTTEDISDKLDTLFAMFPNMKKEDAQLLRSSLMFCHYHRKGIIKGIKPFLLVGEPGCGKTRFVTKFSSMILGQKKTEFVACGASRGASYIVGITPDYKGAEEGLVLRSLWESNPGFLTLNPIIVLDEVDKCGFHLSNDNDLYGTLCTVLSDQCAEYFKDAFFDIPIHFWPLYFATANSIESMPAAILDRFHIIRFAELTKEDMLNTVIPEQYRELRDEVNGSDLPGQLSPEDVMLVYRLCNGKARNIKMAIQQLLVKFYDAEGKRKNSVSEDELVYMAAGDIKESRRKIGFC